VDATLPPTGGLVSILEIKDVGRSRRDGHASDGHLDLKTRTLSGKMLEWS
jgi:hypothetical protein